MFKFEIGRAVAAIALTILTSSACVLSAIGPAQAGSAPATVSAARPQA